MRIHQRSRHGGPEQRQIVPDPLPPERWLVSPEKLAPGSRQVDTDENPAVDEASVKVGPHGKKDGAGRHRPARPSLQQAQENQRGEEGKEMWPGVPMANAQNYRERDHEVRE